MTDTAALAILTDGSRIPLSEPLDEARRLFRDQQYDSDVIGIEAEPVSQPVPPSIYPQELRQEAMQL